MTIISAILIILAVLAALLGGCWMFLRWDGERQERYDERQKEAMGTAYRLAFWVGVVYLFIIMIFSMEGALDNTWLLIVGGMMLMLMTYRFCCLLLNVGNPLFQNPKVSLGCDIFLIVSTVTDIIAWSGMNGAPLAEMDDRFWFDMILSVCFILICIMDVAELHRNREEIA